MTVIARRAANLNLRSGVGLALLIILCGPGSAAQPSAPRQTGAGFKLGGFPKCGEDAIKRGGLPKPNADGDRLYLHVEDTHGQDFEVWCMDNGYQYGFFVSHTEYPAGTLPENMNLTNPFHSMVVDEVDRCEFPIGLNEITLGYDPDSAAAPPPTTMVSAPAPAANGVIPPLPAGTIAPTPFPTPPPDGKPAASGTGTIKLPGRLTKYYHHNYSAKEKELEGSDEDFHTIYKYSTRSTERINTKRTRDEKTRRFSETFIANSSFNMASECAFATQREIALSGVLHVTDFDLAVVWPDGITRTNSIYAGREEVASVAWNLRTQSIVVNLQPNHPPPYLSLELPVDLFGDPTAILQAAVDGRSVDVNQFRSGNLIGLNLLVPARTRQVMISAEMTGGLDFAPGSKSTSAPPLAIPAPNSDQYDADPTIIVGPNGEPQLSVPNTDQQRRASPYPQVDIPGQPNPTPPYGLPTPREPREPERR